MKRGFVLMAVVLSMTMAAGAQAPSERRPVSTLKQVMQAILFPNANIVFSAQGTDPASVPRDLRSSLSTNALTGLYGGWQAIENSGLALTDAADLLSVTGRLCSNGRPAPVQEAAWKAAVEGLRESGLAAAAAARARSQEKIVDVAEQVTNACSACHRIYRGRENPCVASPVPLGR